MTDTAVDTLRPLPVGSVGHHASGFWTMLCVILTEGALFAYLEFSYFYIAVRSHQYWPPSGMPDFKISAPNTGILILSSVAVWWGERSIRRENNRFKLMLGLGIGLLLGLLFIAGQGLEWANKSYSLYSDPYGSAFFTITGFHLAHVIVGCLVLACLLLWSALGYFARGRSAYVTIGALYWHFVDAVWITVFFTLYLTPFLR